MSSFPPISPRPSLPVSSSKPKSSQPTASQSTPTGDVFFSGRRKTSPTPTQQLETLLEHAGSPTDPLTPAEVQSRTFELLAKGANLEQTKNGKSLQDRLEGLTVYSNQALEHAKYFFRREEDRAGLAQPVFDMKTFAPCYAPDTPAFKGDSLQILRAWKGNFNKSANWKPSHNQDRFHERTPLLQENSLD